MRPLRLLAIFARFLAGWLWTLAVSATACVLAVLVGPTRMWLIVRQPWARGALWLVGVRLRVEGAEHLAGPAVFVANHQSLIDVVFLPALVPRTARFVAKRELLYIPLWGWAFAAGGAVLVDRTRPRAALAAIRRGLRRLPRDWSILVFPEGTRPRDGTLGPFKRGGFHMAIARGLPVVPLGFDGARDVVPGGAWLVRPGEVRVTVGAPMPSVGLGPESAGELAERARAAVAACIARSAARAAAADRRDEEALASRTGAG